ncbi:DNA breaking-rejoining enzyme [Moniliophthora roreri]|nr:DNA breaking-rejoining enzyme [Moniliophthora roreri]
MVGNPSVSQQVSLYMVSLRHCKVKDGEEPMSARAITLDIIGHMYDFNRKSENFDIKPVIAQKRNKDEKNPDQWGGPRLCRLMQFIYCISFVCLLRIDEALKINFDYIEYVSETDGKLLKLTLPFRKTNQYGDIKPFFIQEFPPELAHLCLVRAYKEWICVSRITSGYICCKVNSGDQPSNNDSDAMTSLFFLEKFRNNLIDISIDPNPYGTHSFHHGGCQ